MLDLVSALESGLDRPDGEEWDDKKVHVSDLAVALDDGKCPKALWLRLNGAEKEPFNAGQKLMFQQGNNLHELATELIIKGVSRQHTYDVDSLNFYFTSEIPVEIQGITGRYDLLITHAIRGSNRIEKEKTIIDFKTVRGNAFNYLNEPKPSNILQVQAYMLATNSDYGMLLYIDREGQNFARQFEVKRDDEKVLKAIEETKKIAESDIAPPEMKPTIEEKENKTSTTIYIKEPWQCSYCQYKGVSCDGCMGEHTEVYENNKTKAGKLLVAHIKDDELKMKPDYEDMSELVV